MRAATLLRSRAVVLLWPASLALAVILVYGSSLSYPFFWVDPIDIGLAGSRSISTILTNSQGYLYYRPFAFILWKVLHALSGRFDPFAFHLVQVLSHVLNVWLFYALARRIFALRFTPHPNPLPGEARDGVRVKPRLLAGLAALCFAWYPASYQTVTWVIAPQVQATMFLLASAIAYYDGRTSADRRKIWLSLALLAIALPFQENAISFGFVIAALEIYLALNHPASQLTIQPTPRLRPWPLAHIGLCLAFAALWFLIPKDPDSAVARFEPAAGWYLLQGLIWPIAGAVGGWRTWLAGAAWQPLIFVAPPTLLFLFFAYHRARRLALLGFGLVWFAVMVLPIWATRGISYVGVSPRIFYVGAPGAILIWVGLLSLNLQAPIPNRLWRMGTGLLIGFSLMQSIAFLAIRKDLQDGSMPAVWDVIHSGQQAGSAAKLLYINVPDQITPRLREYPVGFFRAILMPVSVDLGQYVELQTGIRPAAASLSVPALAGLEAFPHQVDLRGRVVDQVKLSAAIRAAAAVFFTEYDPNGRVRIVEAGSLQSPSSSSHPAMFDNRAGLVDADAAANGDRFQVTLTWDCLGPFDSQETIFVHAIDAGGQLVAQADGDPVRGLFPLSECKTGEQIRDVRFVAVAPGAHSIRVGIYNRVTGERLTATDANGQTLPENAVTIGQVTR
ncbi:MAG TPA: hypothetical protein VJG32_08410 [Anaerolineae bacterium]|nr:hypothetical protein [Anaerolineae bacterium]